MDSSPGTGVALHGIVDLHELTITLTDGSACSFRGGYRELNLLRARLLMALDGQETGVVTHVLPTGRVSIRADQLREVGSVRPT